jgi:hypothetical protein
MRSTRLRGAALVALASAVLSSCGGSDGGSSAQVESKGRLKADPDPLTLTDLSRVPKDSPQETVLRLYFWAQWGSAPNIAAVYDRAFQEGLGIPRIADAFVAVRPELLISSPRIVGTERNRLGTLVTVELRTRYGRPQLESFLLQRRSGGWVIVYDTLLQRAMGTLAQSRVVAGRAKPGRAALARATVGAARASRQYRVVALSASGADGLKTLLEQLSSG